jgi:hypothetical protein
VRRFGGLVSGAMIRVDDGLNRSITCACHRERFRDNALGPHTILGGKRKRDAANIALANRDVHQPTDVLING